MFIKLLDIKKRYIENRKEIWALNGITLDINEGDFISFVGNSGAGKSTLLLTIAGLIKPTSGNIYFDSNKVTSLSDNRWAAIRRENIGIIFQKKVIVPHLTVKENILLPLILIDDKDIRFNCKQYAMELMEEYDILKYENYLPGNISGGELQKLLILRALITKPKILLADEPTGDLDASSSEFILKKLLKLNKSGTTIIMVTHNKNLASYSKNIYKIDKGKITKNIK